MSANKPFCHRLSIKRTTSSAALRGSVIVGLTALPIPAFAYSPRARVAGGVATNLHAYDHRGRMARKDIKRRGAEPQSIAYTWDGWNIIREAHVSRLDSRVTHNVWGLDLDGTLQGAGGVGGLLAVVRDDGVFLPAYDANGNITEYVSTNGEVVAHYDYSPFGEQLIASGQLADTFTHRFSTKPWCADTGLSEYQMRKYRPDIGRWMSRDPIGEWGGMALIGFIFNNPIDMLDLNGLVARHCSFAVGADRLAMAKWDEVSLDVAKSLGGVHVDILYSPWNEEFTLIRIGYGGGEGRANNTDVSRYGRLSLTIRDNGILRWGLGKGVCCKNATCEQIAECIKNAPSPPKDWLDNGVIWMAINANCQNDVEHAVLGCCLEGYHALNLNTGPEDFPGEETIVQKCVDNFWRARKRQIDEAPSRLIRFLRLVAYYNDLGNFSYLSAVRSACWRETMTGIHD